MYFVVVFWTRSRTTSQTYVVTDRQILFKNFELTT